VAVARKVSTPIALGEEWRTVFDARPRFERGAAAIVQPEMGRTGITQFMRIATLAQSHHIEVIPHASVGVGIFLAASLQASSAIQNLPAHEFQHSIFAKNLRFLAGEMACAEGFYSLPEGSGLGIEPNEDAIGMLQT
jgi:L-alanine-DL-glutamate epimerase-like enolase superfamily enzyme